MKLFKQVSQRTDNKGRNYIDYYLAYTYEGKNYFVRIQPCFYRDVSLLYNNAEEVPSGDMLDKYM